MRPEPAQKDSLAAKVFCAGPAADFVQVALHSQPALSNQVPCVCLSTHNTLHRTGALLSTASTPPVSRALASTSMLQSGPSLLPLAHPSHPSSTKSQVSVCAGSRECCVCARLPVSRLQEHQRAAAGGTFGQTSYGAPARSGCQSLTQTFRPGPPLPHPTSASAVLFAILDHHVRLREGFSNTTRCAPAVVGQLVELA